MNLRDSTKGIRSLAFRLYRAAVAAIPGGRISAFCAGEGGIGAILVLNLDRQPRRFRRTMRELARFQTRDGDPLTSITTRLPAIDARDGRAVAATADVDPMFRLADQLYVQPDVRLEECFGLDQVVRMTRQEIAVARSHVEAWKTIASGEAEHVLVLEDDVWFRPGAAAAIDRGWREATQRVGLAGPRMLYLSYEDAGGTCERVEVCEALFRPVRGLWFLSGYVLSRDGAAALLRAMPVVGPVDMWINRRFDQLAPLAVRTPVILQRADGGSDNSYSVLPFLAQAGVVDADAVCAPSRTASVRVLAWTADGDREPLAMALSMSGLRVRTFDPEGDEVCVDELNRHFSRYDALVNVRLTRHALSVASTCKRTRFVIEPNTPLECPEDVRRLPSPRTAFLPDEGPGDTWWGPLSSLIDIQPPLQDFPSGPPRTWRMFRDDSRALAGATAEGSRQSDQLDDTAWAILPEPGWPTCPVRNCAPSPQVITLMDEALTTPTFRFHTRVGTFPGNRAAFAKDAVVHSVEGAVITMDQVACGDRIYRSGALVSTDTLLHGRVEARIKAARGSGLVTGFFLHRDSPRQEIDIEFMGNDPHRMLVNVYFNPGDEGTALDFGYRGSPCCIDLGFDASLDFHAYSIEWRPDRISWFVDGLLVHERGSWDPTPIPHLPMKLHANLWSPRSESLAGKLKSHSIPSTATFSDVAIRRFMESHAETTSLGHGQQHHRNDSPNPYEGGTAITTRTRAESVVDG